MIIYEARDGFGIDSRHFGEEKLVKEYTLCIIDETLTKEPIVGI
jgi:hypothetical protein